MTRFFTAALGHAVAAGLLLCHAQAVSAAPLPNGARLVSITAREQPIAAFLQDTGTRHEVTAAAHARLLEASARYGDDAGEMTVCKVIEDDAGVALRAEGTWVPPWEVRHAADA